MKELRQRQVKKYAGGGNTKVIELLDGEATDVAASSLVSVPTLLPTLHHQINSPQS